MMATSITRSKKHRRLRPHLRANAPDLLADFTLDKSQPTYGYSARCLRRTVVRTVSQYCVIYEVRRNSRKWRFGERRRAHRVLIVALCIERTLNGISHVHSQSDQIHQFIEVALP